MFYASVISSCRLWHYIVGNDILWLYTCVFNTMIKIKNRVVRICQLEMEEMELLFVWQWFGIDWLGFPLLLTLDSLINESLWDLNHQGSGAGVFWLNFNTKM